MPADPTAVGGACIQEAWDSHCSGESGHILRPKIIPAITQVFQYMVGLAVASHLNGKYMKAFICQIVGPPFPLRIKQSACGQNIAVALPEFRCV